MHARPSSVSMKMNLMADGVSNPKSFLMHIGPDLLNKYATAHEIVFQADEEEKAEPAADRFLVAVEASSDVTRDKILSEIQSIADMSGERGFQYLSEGASRMGRPVAHTEMEELKNYYERALWFHLNRQEIFFVVARTFDLDLVTGWRRVAVPKVDKAQIIARIDALRDSLKETYAPEFRGKRLAVQPIDRDDRIYLIAYIEDLPESKIQFDDEGMHRARPHRPVIEAYFLYRPTEGVLEVKAKGGRPKILKLQRAFAEVMLNFDVSAVEPVTYNFDLLKDLSKLTFDVPEEDGVAGVRMKALRLIYPDGKKKITLEVEDEVRWGCDAMAEMIQKHNIPPGIRVHQAVLQVKFKPTGKGKPRSVTVRVTYPSLHDLCDRPEDQIVRRLLKSWGIDTM